MYAIKGNGYSQVRQGKVMLFEVALCETSKDSRKVKSALKSAGFTVICWKVSNRTKNQHSNTYFYTPYAVYSDCPVEEAYKIISDL